MIHWYWLLASVPLGIIAGWAGATVTSMLRSPVRLEDIAKYMTQVVNVEEVESNIRLRRAAMMRAGRRTTRVDDKAVPAKVMRMRVRRKGSRHRPANP